MKKKKVLAFFLFCFFPALYSHAYWVWSPEAGKFVNPEGASQDSSEEKFDYAMKFYKDKNLDQAAEQFKEVLKKFPNSRVAPEAEYRLGTIFEEKGDYLKAFKAYKNIVETYPQSERFNEVIEREYKIGNIFLGGKKAKLAGLEILPSLPRAEEVFRHIIQYAPYGENGDKAQFQLGVTYKKMGRYGDAVEAFQSVIDHYPQSELVAKARYELAETSYDRSASEYRDQRALDDASKQVNRYIASSPDGEESETAAKLRQAIDEKNAEKNYRIGEYYEKENYLQSALIYYSDVFNRYPQTMWGQKASVKLKSLKQPAEFLTGQEKDLDKDIQSLEEQLKGIPEKEDLERGGLKRKLEILRKRRDNVEKNKKSSMSSREQDLDRRERELNDKFKNLEKKKKSMAKNNSEDFKRAMDRWHASLVEERDQLLEERKQLKGWREEMGMPEKKISFEHLPFMGEAPSEIDKVRQVESKKLYKISEEKKALLEEKELLYKQHSEVSALLKNQGVKQRGKASGEETSVTPDLQTQKQKLDSMEENISGMEKQIREKTAVYEKKYGAPNWKRWMSGPAQAVASSGGLVAKSFDKLNPFDEKQTDGNRSREALLERQMHLREKINAQQSIVDTLSKAFDEDLAMQERRRLVEAAQAEKGNPQEVDPAQLRKEIKKTEKEIRGSYEEIQDRHKKKSELLRQLDAKLHENENAASPMVKTGRAAAAPAVAAGKFFKAFIFGLPHKEVELTQSAAKTNDSTAAGEDIRKLREDVELQSMLIEGKSREIINKQKDLEILKARASLAGGYKFRPVLVQVPYQFINEAIDSAKRVVPKKSRQDVILARLNKETQKLESMRVEGKELEKQISGVKTQAPAQKKKTKPEADAAVISASAAPESELKAEIERLSESLESEMKVYDSEKQNYEMAVNAAAKQSRDLEKSEEKAKSSDENREVKLRKDLKDIEEQIAKLIQREKELEAQETAIIEKRIERIDRAVKKVESKMISQDLLTERQRMEERLSQLESRKDFLSKELNRFQMSETPAART